MLAITKQRITYHFDCWWEGAAEAQSSAQMEMSTMNELAHIVVDIPQDEAPYGGWVEICM